MKGKDDQKKKKKKEEEIKTVYALFPTAIPLVAVAIGLSIYTIRNKIVDSMEILICK